MKHLKRKSPIAPAEHSGGRHVAPTSSKRNATNQRNAGASMAQTGSVAKTGSESRGSVTPKTRRILAIICWALLVLFVVALVAYLLHLNSRKTAYEQLARMAHGVSTTYTEDEPAPTSTPASLDDPATEPADELLDTPTSDPAEIPIDFDYLCSINDDIIGWIMVDGTYIDYPILYDSASSWSYLNHDYWLNYSLSGSIYVKDDNASDFSDFNTVIYGHNMNNGSMFAPLHEFRDQDFFDQHDTVIIYTPNRKLTYRIFAAYRTDNSNLSVVYDYDTSEQREDYLEHIYSHTKIAFYDMDVPVSADDKIITLSTCINHQAAYRYLVQAVLVSDQPGIYAFN